MSKEGDLTLGLNRQESTSKAEVKFNNTKFQ